MIQHYRQKWQQLELAVMVMAMIILPMCITSSRSYRYHGLGIFVAHELKYGLTFTEDPLKRLLL